MGRDARQEGRRGHGQGTVRWRSSAAREVSSPRGSGGSSLRDRSIDATNELDPSLGGAGGGGGGGGASGLAPSRRQPRTLAPPLAGPTSEA